MSIHLSVRNVQLSYDGFKEIFVPLSFEAAAGSVIALTGNNGAGKSSLMLCIAGLLRPWRGQCELAINGTTVNNDKRSQYTGYVAPAMTLYDELSALEHLKFDAKMRSLVSYEPLIQSSLQRFGLYERRNDSISSFSTGMRQRAKLVVASYFSPALLLLDEPTSNLDEEGFEACSTLISELSRAGSIVIIATNDERERALASTEIRLHQ